MGAELEKGRNLWAETSGGQIRKGPKPLATLASITVSIEINFKQTLRNLGQSLGLVYFGNVNLTFVDDWSFAKVTPSVIKNKSTKMQQTMENKSRDQNNFAWIY